jgi:aspartyl/asparaginyl beta-hydroxylase (cupin superfamily)
MTGLASGSAPLMQQAADALAKGEAAKARLLLDAIIDAGQADASAWVLMSRALRALGDPSGEGAAIDRALALSPKDLRALLAKGDHLAAAANARGASSYYTAALQYMPRYDSLPPDLQEGLRRAQMATQQVVRELEDFVRGRLDSAGVRAETAPPRFRNAVDILFGRKQAYVQQPRYLYYPELPQIQFYTRGEFPWLDRVEAALADVREELKGVIGADFKPYVTQPEGRARKDQQGLTNNPDWSAYFLRKDGIDQPGLAKCPKTMAALTDAPLTQIPNRAPSILFSKLAGGAHIPPHTGMLNTRLVAHLPLIVPAGCEFRVGNDMRVWEEGKAWVFDDTIEHEAWNRSGVDRYILIFDVWRPELSEEERVSVATLCEAIDAYRGRVAWDD